MPTGLTRYSSVVTVFAGGLQPAASRTLLPGYAVPGRCPKRAEEAEGPPGGFRGRTSSCPSRPLTEAPAQVRGSFLRLSPALVLCSRKLSHCPWGLWGLQSQPAGFKGHQATPPIRVCLSFASIKFSINLVSGQYRFSVRACLEVQITLPSEATL